MYCLMIGHKDLVERLLKEVRYYKKVLRDVFVMSDHFLMTEFTGGGIGVDGCGSSTPLFAHSNNV